MKIIFDEEKYCENLLINNQKKILLQDLKLLAAYFFEKNNNNDEIIKNIEEYCLKIDKNFNKIQNFKILEKSLKYALRNHLRKPIPISITKSELQSIQSLDNYMDEKFLFMMLVTAKFYKFNKSINKPKSNKYDTTLYSNCSIKEIQKWAGISFTKTYWKEFKNRLTTKGIISPTIFGANSWAMGIWDQDSKPEIIIEDFRNPIAYYQEYCGDRMIECNKCHVKISQNSNRHAMCKNCWKEINREQIRKRVEKHRNVTV